MGKAYKNRNKEELIDEIKELKKEIRRKDQAFRRIINHANNGNVGACKQTAGNQINRR